MSTTAPKKASSSWSLAIDYGPLLVFFLVYKFGGHGSGPVEQLRAIMLSTGAFMVATIIALAVSKWRLGKISPMLWLSTILVVGFGGLTIWMHDPKFIQLKPTLVYALLGALLLGGLALGKPLLKVVLEAGYDGLDDHGWVVLSRNWGLFFVAMAGVNETLRAFLDFDAWLTAKVWLLPVLSILFAAAHIPFMMRHGLGDEDQAAAAKPPEG